MSSLRRKAVIEQLCLEPERPEASRKHHWWHHRWMLFCRFVSLSPEPQLQHNVCAGRNVWQPCILFHGSHTRAATGMNVDIRGDAQIGALLAILCIFWSAGGKPICLSAEPRLWKVWRESSCWRILFRNKSCWTVIANPLCSVIEYAHLVLWAFSS